MTPNKRAIGRQPFRSAFNNKRVSLANSRRAMEEKLNMVPMPPSMSNPAIRCRRTGRSGEFVKLILSAHQVFAQLFQGI